MKNTGFTRELKISLQNYFYRIDTATIKRIALRTIDLMSIICLLGIYIMAKYVSLICASKFRTSYK